MLVTSVGLSSAARWSARICPPAVRIRTLVTCGSSPMDSAIRSSSRRRISAAVARKPQRLHANRCGCTQTAAVCVAMTSALLCANWRRLASWRWVDMATSKAAVIKLGTRAMKVMRCISDVCRHNRAAHEFPVGSIVRVLPCVVHHRHGGIGR
jgi:hypothetical protein